MTDHPCGIRYYLWIYETICESIQRTTSQYYQSNIGLGPQLVLHIFSFTIRSNVMLILQHMDVEKRLVQEDMSTSDLYLDKERNKLHFRLMIRLFLSWFSFDNEKNS